MPHFPASALQRLLSAPRSLGGRPRPVILTVQHNGAYVRYIGELQEREAREKLMGVDVPMGMKKSDVRVYPPTRDEVLPYWFMAVKFEPAT